MADITAVRPQPGITAAGLGFFCLFRPARRAPCSCGESSDIGLQPFVAFDFLPVLPLLVFVPGGEIPLLQVDSGAVDRQNVVNAAVEERPVVGNQNKAAFAAQIGGNPGTGALIEVIGRFVDEQEGIIPAEQRGEQQLGLLAVAEGGKRPEQCLFLHIQTAKLPQQAPFLRVRTDFRQYGGGPPFGPLHRIGKICKGYRCPDAAACVEFTGEQF